MKTYTCIVERSQWQVVTIEAKNKKEVEAHAWRKFDDTKPMHHHLEVSDIKEYKEGEDE